MRLLLDTHTLLWFALDDSQLSATARDLIMRGAREDGAPSELLGDRHQDQYEKV